MNNKPVGGRGLKAPYQTKTVRVPCPVVEVVEKVIADYRATGNVSSKHISTVTAEEALEKARLIYKSRDGRTKSAKSSLEKLLQVIYGEEFVV